MHDIEKLIREKFEVSPKSKPPYSGRVFSTRETLYELFAEAGYTQGAEIGVNRGSNALQMFNRIPNLTLICVDPWRRNDRAFAKANRRLNGCNVIWKRMTGMEAVKDVKNESLDFVYIDGLHDFDNVIMDLIHWVPKVRAGGIVSGHDYFHSEECHVPRAVDAYILAHGICNLHLTRDNLVLNEFPYSPSFFWVKE